MGRMPIRVRLATLAVLLALGAQTMAHAVEGSRQYTVKSGDTLGSISVGLGVPVGRLAELNGLGDADHILAGQTLVVPEDGAAAPAVAAPSAPAPAPGQEYVVRSGDTLAKIAQQFGISTA